VSPKGHERTRLRAAAFLQRLEQQRGLRHSKPNRGEKSPDCEGLRRSARVQRPGPGSEADVLTFVSPRPGMDSSAERFFSRKGDRVLGVSGFHSGHPPVALNARIQGGLSGTWQSRGYS
jgi:hypothetical protein